MVEIGDIVLIKDSTKGYLPAIVETVYSGGDPEGLPDVALVVFVTGYHGASYAEKRVSHGDPKKPCPPPTSKVKEYITRKERRQLREEEHRAKLTDEQLDALKSLRAVIEEEVQAKAD